MRVRPVGDRGLLVECSGAVAAAATAAAVRGLPGVAETVPAAATVLVLAADPRALPTVARALAAMDEPEAVGTRGPVTELDVVYDGEDLPVLATALGMSAAALVERHTAAEWTSAFIGFAPGFAYLAGSGELPEVPRRTEPRVTVPPGSVAMAGPWSAVYPRASPGGWQLLGRTDGVVWDPDRTPPAVLVPGTRVRFRPVRPTAAGGGARRDGAAPGAGVAATRARPTTPPVGDLAPAHCGPGGPGWLEVIATGPMALVEDLGRPGLLDVGVPPGGALDRSATVRANRLVGNPRGAAVVEVTFGGLVLRAHRDLVLAVTGAPADVEIRAGGDEGRPVPAGRDRPFALPDGALLTLGTPTTGARTYVAVRGGIAAPVVLGSRSVDVLSGLGRPLAVGDRLPVGAPPGDAVAAVPDLERTPRPGPCRVRVRPGPRADRLDPAGPPVTGRPWTVLDASNRVGLRLDGPPLRTLPGELASEGTVPGAVQVPPSGRPVVFLADHPVTGGYPVVAVVVEEDLDRLGQVRPGQEVVLLEA